MNIVTDVILPIALAFIMFSLGLGLSINDFTRIFLKPKEFFIGFFSQLIILPIVALILVSIWPLSPEIAIGVMILAAAPGGATSNILTSFAKGDVVLGSCGQSRESKAFRVTLSCNAQPLLKRV